MDSNRLKNYELVTAAPVHGLSCFYSCIMFQSCFSQSYLPYFLPCHFYFPPHYLDLCPAIYLESLFSTMIPSTMQTKMYFINPLVFKTIQICIQICIWLWTPGVFEFVKDSPARHFLQSGLDYGASIHLMHSGCNILNHSVKRTLLFVIPSCATCICKNID